MFTIKHLSLALLALTLIASPTRTFAQSCSMLRWACENKSELGLEGAGTCQRYRERCTVRRTGRCEQLRWACENKEQLGLEGAGTCRRYRDYCR